jgi:hypothetical protein
VILSEIKKHYKREWEKPVIPGDIGKSDKKENLTTDYPD